MRTVVNFAVPFSPNVGDGVIHRCLEHALKQAVDGVEVVSIDISGRETFGQKPVPYRELILAVFGYLPPALRRRIAAAGLDRLIAKKRARWAAAAAGAEAAVIGGGQLFADADLNFPKKIGAVAEISREAGLPVAVFGAGVGSSWSAEGAALFQRLNACDLRAVALRDEASCARWRGWMGGAPACVYDPGVLSADAFGIEIGPVAASLQGARVGLGVAAGKLLSHHADQAIGGGGDVVGFFAALAEEIVRRGGAPVLFTNGAVEDEAELDKTLARLSGAGASVERAPRPLRPEDLAATIAGVDAVIAHRLHASIVAYALGRPTVGLGWDSKVEAFYRSVDRAAFATTSADPSACAELLAQSIATPPDPDQRRRVADAALAQTRDLAAALGLVGP